MTYTRSQYVQERLAQIQGHAPVRPGMVNPEECGAILLKIEKILALPNLEGRHRLRLQDFAVLDRSYTVAESKLVDDMALLYLYPVTIHQEANLRRQKGHKVTE